MAPVMPDADVELDLDQLPSFKPLRVPLPFSAIPPPPPQPRRRWPWALATFVIGIIAGGIGVIVGFEAEAPMMVSVADRFPAPIVRLPTETAETETSDVPVIGEPVRPVTACQ